MRQSPQTIVSSRGTARSRASSAKTPRSKGAQGASASSSAAASSKPSRGKVYDKPGRPTQFA